VAGGQIFGCQNCTQAFHPINIWFFSSYFIVSNSSYWIIFLGKKCSLRSEYLLQCNRKCSSISTSPLEQSEHSLSSLGSQVCLWRPVSIARLCSLIYLSINKELCSYTVDRMSILLQVTNLNVPPWLAYNDHWYDWKWEVEEIDNNRQMYFLSSQCACVCLSDSLRMELLWKQTPVYFVIESSSPVCLVTVRNFKRPVDLKIQPVRC
jgi:hypothetical protein